MYVATIHAKVARILKKLGLGQAKGQELLYSHLVRLQAMLDKVGQTWAPQVAIVPVLTASNKGQHLAEWVTAFSIWVLAFVTTNDIERLAIGRRRSRPSTRSSSLRPRA